MAKIIGFLGVSKTVVFETDLCALIDIIYINLIKSHTADLLTN